MLRQHPAGRGSTGAPDHLSREQRPPGAGRRCKGGSAIGGGCNSIMIRTPRLVACEQREQRGKRAPRPCVHHVIAAQWGHPTEMGDHRVGVGLQIATAPTSSGFRSGCGREIGPRSKGPEIAHKCEATVGLERPLGKPGGLFSCIAVHFNRGAAGSSLPWRAHPKRQRPAGYRTYGARHRTIGSRRLAPSDRPARASVAWQTGVVCSRSGLLGAMRRG